MALPPYLMTMPMSQESNAKADKVTAASTRVCDDGSVDELKFGTDGWRDVIADRFTFTNLERAARGYAAHVLENGGKRVLVGYDTRFLGREFAGAAASVLASEGLEVAVSAEYLPTPALSFAVKHFGAYGGVMITASHNPPEYSGFKLKGGYGGGATSDVYVDVSARVASQMSASRGVGGPAGKAVQEFDVRHAYYDALADLVDLSAFEGRGLRLVHDSMGGAGSGWLEGFVTHTGADLVVEPFRGRPDPLFHGVNPEPIALNLAATQARMRQVAEGGQGGPSFAACTDGDADRIGAVLPGGTYFNSHQIVAVLVDHLSSKGLPGKVVKTFTVGRVVEKLAASRGLEVVETPVGFKYVVDALVAGDVLVGGEESGGIGVFGHIPERDGIANALLLLESEVVSGEPLGARFARIERETGVQHAYDRVDLKLADSGLVAKVKARLEDAPTAYAGLRVTSVERLDGVKLNLEDGSWVLFRASGTEPLLRLYSEAPDDAAVNRNLRAAVDLVERA